VAFENQLYLEMQWGNILEDSDIPMLLNEYEG
jgi:hypothetical protein